MRLLIAECKQEVSTFNPHLSRYEDFAIRRGEELLAYHRQVRNEVGGALSVFDRRPDLTIVPTYSAHFITSGGTLREACWQQIAGELLEAIDQASRQGPVDGIYLSMHGAMASEQQSDPEGYLLEQIAGRFGISIPIVVSLDLHGILTDRMLRHCDAVVPYHTYPHVDFYETGRERKARDGARHDTGSRARR
jgi:microcystin degradation protein MlrC